MVTDSEELMGQARLGTGEGVPVATDAGEGYVGADRTPVPLDGFASHTDALVIVTRWALGLRPWHSM